MLGKLHFTEGLKIQGILILSAIIFILIIHQKEAGMDIVLMVPLKMSLGWGLTQALHCLVIV